MYKTCHTEESTRRQRELEQGLLEAMGRQPYKKITLTELCRQLNVPRKTFYRYFPTKEDCLLALIDHTLSDCNAVALTGWTGSTGRAGPAAIFPLLAGKQTFSGCDPGQRVGKPASGTNNCHRRPYRRSHTEFTLCHGASGVLHRPRTDVDGTALASVWLSQHTGGNGRSIPGTADFCPGFPVPIAVIDKIIPNILDSHAAFIGVLRLP